MILYYDYINLYGLYFNIFPSLFFVSLCVLSRNIKLYKIQTCFITSKRKLTRTKPLFSFVQSTMLTISKPESLAPLDGLSTQVSISPSALTPSAVTPSTITPTAITPTSLAQSATSVEYIDCLCQDGIQERFTNEQFFLNGHGYKMIKKLGDTLQGEMYEAEIFDENALIKSSQKDEKNKRVNIVGDYENNHHVIIKKTKKKLAYQKLSKDEDGFNIIVDEDIVKEMILMYHITVDNTPLGHYISQFIHFFESDSDYYLVTEYAGKYNLEQFSRRAHKYLKEKKLSLKEWKKIVRFIFWQISVTLYWLHLDLGICHLDLRLENILLKNAKFIQDKNGNVTISQNITIKLTDFGVAEIFKPELNEHETFKCCKNHYGSQYKAPQVFDNNLSSNIYDARKADIFELGIILFKLSCGYDLYKTANINDNGYLALIHRKIPYFIDENNLSLYFNWKILSILDGLLRFNEIDRYDIYQVIQTQYLQIYYSKYKTKIESKSAKQKKINKQQHKKLSLLPYYKMNKTKSLLLSL